VFIQELRSYASLMLDEDVSEPFLAQKCRILRGKRYPAFIREYFTWYTDGQ
jgi:hypothetical protein